MEGTNILPVECLEDSRKYIRADMENIAANFLKLGFHLYEVHRNGTYTHAGYSGVAEFAETEFGIKRSTCYNLMKLVTEYSRDGHSMFLEDKYKGLGYSQLVEMLSLSEESKKKVKPDMSIAQIREIKKFGSVVDLQEQEKEVKGYCDFIRKNVKPFSRENVKYDISDRCEHHQFNSELGMLFMSGFIEGRHYRYTQSSLLECIEKYVGFDEEPESVQISGLDSDVESVQTSGLDAETEPPHQNFEEKHDQMYETPLADVLMDCLKNNIKNVDKVKAIIDYLNSWF